VKDNFVAVAVDGRRAMGRKDAEGTFIRETCGLRLAGAGGNVVCVTASGKLLGHIVGANGQQCDPRRALEEWKQLPEGERKAGATKVGERGPVDPAHAQPEPPRGGLILKQYYRMLAEGTSGELRHVVLRDFDHHEQLAKYRDPQAPRHYFEAAPDFVWLTETEWQSLIPSDPQVGHRSSAPAALRDRLFRFHLVPDITFGESNGWHAKQVRGGNLDVTVEEVTPVRLRLKITGSAELGLDYDAAQAKSRSGGHSAHGYEPRLLGYIGYDRTKQRIDQFEMVAVGGFYGTLYGDNRILYRSGRTPLGVAFELVTADSPAADRQVPPRAARFPRNFFSGAR
jgi:hypothetical protein